MMWRVPGDSVKRPFSVRSRRAVVIEASTRDVDADENDGGEHDGGDGVKAAGERLHRVIRSS